MNADELDLGRLCSVVHAVVIEVHAGGMVPAAKVEGEVAKVLAEPAIVRRDTWGLGPSAEEGLSAMMDLVGGPAPMRDP